MNINNLFTSGKDLVLNPKWTKDNKEPKYIINTPANEVKLETDPIAEMASRAVSIGSQDILGTEEDLKYFTDKGITPTDSENLYKYYKQPDIDDTYQDEQGFWTKLGNALAQTIVSEIGLGTIKSFSDLVDVVGQAVGLSSPDYTNPVSETLEQWQEQFREFAPVNVAPGVHINTGGLTDWGWWFNQMPSVVSSLTLLLPSGAVTKGASMAGKALNVGQKARQLTRAASGVSRKIKAAQELKALGKSAKEIEAARKLNKVQKWITKPSTASQTSLFLENATTAALSRTIENHQEARQTYNDMYAQASDYFKQISDEDYAKIVNENKDILEEEGVDTNDRDAVARAIAKVSADKTFRMDWANIVFDVVEMYGLRNAWKGFSNAPARSAKVRRANKDLAKYFGKSEDEIKALKKARGFKEKALEKIEDFTYASKLTIAAQLSEGAEEAINNIASAEGMYLGDVMLGKSDGNKTTGFLDSWVDVYDTRLARYMASPDLWDAAFWGVMGGIVFQGLGSKFIQIKNKFGNNSENLDDEAKAKLPWYKLDSLPEIRRRLRDIQARSVDFVEYNDKLQRINNGIDVENSTEDNEVHFSSELAQEAAREKLKNEYITKMTLRAMKNGNIEMLKAYLANDNVRKGLLQAGMFGKHESELTPEQLDAEAKRYTDEVIKKIDEVQSAYETELMLVDDAAAYASNSIKHPITSEYIQIIALDNLNSKLQLNDNQLTLNATNAEIARLESEYGDKLDKNINHAANIRLGILASELGKLRARRKKLIEAKGDKLSTDIAVHNIDKQINEIEKELTDAELQWATFQSLRYTQDDNGNIIQGDEKAESEAYAYRDKMIIQATEKSANTNVDLGDLASLGISARASRRLTTAGIGEYRTLEQDSQKSFDSVRKISPQLEALYEFKAVLDINNNYYKNNIAHTTEEVAYEAGVLHNTMNKARRKVIDGAFDVIANLYNKYGDDIKTLISNRLSDKRDKELEKSIAEKMDAKDKASLDFHLDALGLKYQYNKLLGERISNKLASEDKKKKNDIDANNKPVEESEEEAATSTTSNKQQPVTNPQETNNRQPVYYAKFYGTRKNGKIVYESTKHSSTDNNGAAIYDNGDGTFTVDVRDNTSMKHDDRMFSNASTFDLTRPHEVAVKPIARRNKKGKLEIIRKGELVYTDTQEYQQQQAQREAQAQAEAEQEAQEQSKSEEVGQPEAVQEKLAPTNEEKAEQPSVELAGTNPSTGDVADESQTGSSSAPAAKQTQPTEEKPSSEEKPATTKPSNKPKPSESAKPTEQEKPKPTKQKTEPLDVIWSEAPQEDSVRNTALGLLLKAYKDDKDTDLDELAKSIIEEQIKYGVDRNIAEPAVTKALETIKRVIERRTKAKNPTFNSSVDELVVTQSTMLTSGYADGNKAAIEAYQSAVQAMISFYAKEFNLNQINGKYYINLENLLRYVNRSTKDSSLASVLYDSLKQYLTSEEGKKLYGITDGELLPHGEAINNIAKSRLQRLEERLDLGRDYRVDLKSLANEAETEEEREELKKAFDSLNPNDKLTFKKENKRLIIYTPDGKKVGSLAIPGINSIGGSFICYQAGLKYDLAVANGKVSSPIREVISKWMDAKTEATKEIDEIIREIAYGIPSEERKEELYKRFETNPEFIRAKNLGLVSDRASIKQIVEGLVGIWQYTEIDITSPKEIQDINKRASIDSWFAKLYNDFAAIYQVSKGIEVDMTVSYLSKKELITIPVEEALPANEAIAGGVNPDVHKVIIGNPRSAYDTIVSGSGHTTSIPLAQGATAVIIDNHYGKPIYVRAYPSDTTDEHLGQDAKDIVKAIHDEADKLLENFAKNPSEESYQALYDFMESIAGAGRGISGLCKGLRFDPIKFGEKQQFSIQFGETKVTFFKQSGRANGGWSTQIRVSNPEFESRQSKTGKSYNSENFYILDKHGDLNKNATAYIHELFNNLSFWVDVSYLDSDNVANKPLNGIASKQDGKFVIKVGDKTWTYNSYNEFLLKNNILKLTTKPNEQNSNFRRRSEAEFTRPELKIKITDKTTSPVEQEQSESEKGTPIAGDSVMQQVRKILDSDSEDKGLEIVKAAIETMPYIDENVIKSFQKLGILPKNIIFDENFNSKGSETESANASVNPTTGVVTVGQKWLDLFETNRSRAIRVLIHEQLHNKLHKNNGYIRSAKQIYKEFKDALDNGKVQGKRNEAELEHLREYLFEKYNEDEALEEFLVESLTNEELARALNDIDAVSTSKKSKNLFQKILELMSKVFGWDVRKGSLYEKELNSLRKFVKDTNVKKESPTTKIINKIVEDGKHVNLTEDELYYLNSLENKLGVRVTTAIAADEENVVGGVPHRFSKVSPWITPSTNIGTGIDEFTRDFFLGKLDKLTAEQLEKKYPNVRGEDWIAFRKQLQEFKDNLLNGKIIKGKKITIVSRDIKAVGQVDVTMPDGSIKKLDVAGTLDLFGYDEDDKFYIFDMKTVHSDSYKKDKEKKEKWKRQLQLYKQLLEEKYGIEVAGTRIIPIKVNYDVPVGATYKDGTDMGGTAVYTVKNPELKTKYNNPNRSQLLQDGQEFREAAPDLQSTIDLYPEPGNIKYEYLEDEAKAVIDGKITADNYKQKNVEQILDKENTEKPIDVEEEIKKAEDTPVKKEFTDCIDDGEFDKYSSVDEQTSNTSNNYTPEMQSIKEKAIANGTFMKARNGNPTNLNEKQWLQVRTANFINWFGDWINNPAEASKVVDENGEPLVVYHGTLAEFSIFDIAKLGEVTGKGYYIDHITKERIPIDSESTFFFTNNKYAANSYKNLAIYNKNQLTSIFYQNLSSIFSNNHYLFTNLEDDKKLKQKEFIDNVLSPILGFDVRREANKILKNESTLTESQRDYYASKFENMALKLKNLPDSRAVSNRYNNLNKHYEDLQFILNNKENLISNTEIGRLKEYDISISTNYGNRSIGDVYIVISKEDDGYYATGIPGTEGMQKITDSNFDLLIDEFKRGIKQNEEQLNKVEQEGHYNRGYVMDVFLNIKNPNIHNYEESAFPDKYKNTKYPTGYIAARQVRKAKSDNNDGVIYKNVRDPFLMDSYGIFNANQVKSATSNNGEFSTTNDDIRYSSIDELPSIQTFAQRLPVSQQADFVSAVASAEISTSCR